MAHAPALSGRTHASDFRLGILLVAGAAITWSFGGAIARFIAAGDSWTIVFWRSVFAAGFLLLFMLLRDGPRGTVQLFRDLGWAGIGVALCFGIASSSFVVALQHTTVANILLIQAAAPLFAALLSWVVLRERVTAATALAIAVVIFGVGVMVSPSFSGTVSPLGDGLALLITVMFSTAIVITRHSPKLRMTPAVCLGTAMAAVNAFFLSNGIEVSAPDLGWLFLFGAVNLGMGLAMFVTGARLVPAALGALVSTLETVLGPIWVWLIHGEVPSYLTIIGGAIVFGALLIHILTDWRRQRVQDRTMPTP
jgi:drug/metabolite transporter (DMT)-like permease